MNVILYTIHCPNCNILQNKMDKKNIQYTIIDDESILEQKGYFQLPILEIDGNKYNFGDAIKWVNKQ